MKTSGSKLMANHGTRRNGYYKSLQGKNYKVVSSYQSRKVLQQLSEGRRFGKILSYVLETDEYLKGITKCSVCLLPLFLISENKLIWVNALFYSTPICSVF